MRRPLLALLLTGLAAVPVLVPGPAGAAGAGTTADPVPTLEANDVQPVYGSSAIITGKIARLANVQLLARRRGEAQFSKVDIVASQADGRFQFTYRVSDDTLLVARSSELDSAPLLLRVKPTLNPRAFAITRVASVTLNGTAAPGVIVTFRIHRAGTAPTDFSATRRAATGADGRWSRTVTPGASESFYVTTPNNLRSATGVIQVR